MFRVQIIGLQMQLRIAHIPNASHQAANSTILIQALFIQALFIQALFTQAFQLATGAPHDQDLGAVGGCP